jgi:hypothetical protein
VIVLADADGSSVGLWRIEADGPRRLLGAFEGASTLARSGRTLLVGCVDGRLLELGHRGEVRVEACLRAAPIELAAGSAPGEWWVLRGGEEPVLELRRAGLVPALVLGLGPGPASLAPIEGSERVWIATPFLLRRFGPGAKLELELALPAGDWRVVRADERHALLLAPGALLAVRSFGRTTRIVRTQGGFGDLVGLASEQQPAGGQ